MLCVCVCVCVYEWSMDDIDSQLDQVGQTWEDAQTGI